MNTWFGQQVIQETSAEEYRAKKVRDFKTLRRLGPLFLLLLIALWGFALWEVIAEGHYVRLIGPAFITWITVWNWRDAPRQHEDAMRTERLFRTITLLPDRINDITKDNLSRVIVPESNVYFAFLTGFSELDGVLELRFAEKPKTFRLPVAVFKNDSDKQEFLDYLRGTIIRKGKLPKAEHLRVSNN